MPIIDVTCADRVSTEVKKELARTLPHSVSLAVECPEEPYDGDLRGGDVILRFHDVGPLDRFDLDVLIEVKSKWFPSRADDRQRRADEILGRAEAVVPADHHVGVYLALPVASWAEPD
ncbi:hypothetical protein SAMN05421776_101242 [Nocardia farcinica]|uniref:Uncharacterized protein n=1 Tax=Nocardia farcinica TaxID=37329 RepID=A0A0H5NHU0_NOCFR|nr:hypothetical protein [Nocardia farcinica]AXK84483.1 hypothetical protein DXT66_01415 [Nocardia farcinica]CRY74819.1 Uncharacterised protein [Nocardia farcinica]SIS61358.1 hypothetical protein SAMN05421776_101242 [Nocardia farcinica]SUE28190.1 Uncharacterised protein [Nocardia farcinica]